MRALSLHQIVVPEIPATELVRIAAGLGCGHVCLFTEMPEDFTRFHVVRDGDIAQLQRVMRENGVTAYGVTSFAIEPGADIAGYERGLERGAQLGAQYASVRMPDPAAAGMAAALEHFARLAATFGMVPSIEVVGLNDGNVVLDTLRIVGEVGAGTLTLDPLHVVRTGALEIYQRLAPEQIGYVQLCDGPASATLDQDWH